MAWQYGCEIISHLVPTRDTATTVVTHPQLAQFALRAVVTRKKIEKLSGFT
jgi:hypothetical protein